MRWIAAFVVLATMAGAGALGLNAQVAAPPTRPREPVPAPGEGGRTRTGGVIVGTVLDAMTGAGVANVAVTIQGPGVRYRIATDPRGRYYFVALPAGDYAIVALKPGYVPGGYGRLRAASDAQTLHLRDREWIVGADVNLWRVATISGIVTDEAGEPIIGVRVNALRREFNGGAVRIASMHEALTDDQGRFRVIGLSPGDYLVMTPSVQVTVPSATFERIANAGSVTGTLIALLWLGAGRSGDIGASAADALNTMTFSDDDSTVMLGGRTGTPPAPVNGRAFAYPTQYYPASDLPSLAVPVTVDAGDDFAGIAFYLRPVGTADVAGIVLGPQGPAAGQLLRLVPDGGEDFGAGFETAATASDPQGRFIFRKVPAGSYLIEGRSAASLSRMTPTLGDGTVASLTAADTVWSRTPVAVSDDDVSGLTIVMHPTSSVTGSVLFRSSGARPRSEEIEGVVLSLLPAAQGRAGSADARPIATGAFAIHGVIPASYYVIAKPPANWFIESIFAGGSDLASDPLDAEPGGDGPRVIVTLTDRESRIEGTVRDARGFPAGRATVLVFPADRPTLPPLRTREARVSSSGTFVVGALPPGAYSVIAIDGADAGNWQDPARLALLRARAESVTTGAGDVRYRDLRLDRSR